MTVAARALGLTLLERASRMIERDPAGFETVIAEMEGRPAYGSITFTLVEGQIVESEVKAKRKVHRRVAG